MQHTLFSFSLLILFLHFTNTLSQSPTPSPVASPPAPPPAHHHPHHSSPPQPPAAAPTDVIEVLLKAGHFINFVRLIKATHVDYQLTSQINSSTDGITVFAPSDTAFDNLKTNIGSLNDKEKISFVQYHVLPRALSKSDFQTLSNPIKTLAGSDNKYTMTITTTDNSVNISTGLTRASVLSTVYTDKQVVIYEVDKVLLPKRLFPPAAAPAAVTSPAAESPQTVANDDDGDHASGASRDYYGVVIGVGMVIGGMTFVNL